MSLEIKGSKSCTDNTLFSFSWFEFYSEYIDWKFIGELKKLFLLSQPAENVDSATGSLSLYLDFIKLAVPVRNITSKNLHHY